MRRFNPLNFSSPTRSFNPSLLSSKRTELQLYGIVAIIDVRSFSPDLLENRLIRLWKLDAPFHIEGQVGNYFLLKFSSQTDLDFVIDNGPWSLDNSFLVVDRLQPNMTLHTMRVSAIPIWVQLWGLPLDYHVSAVAKDLGDVIGTTMTSDTGDIMFSSQLNFLRVKVQVDPMMPLIQNIRIRMDNNVVRTIECKFERVFRSCPACHRIGHTANSCPHSNTQIVEGFVCSKACF